jgi:hypothetical protein
MEKVAALRQLFAEYGYVGDDGPGMTKEALRRMVKYFNQVGPEKFTAAAKKALQSAHNTQEAIYKTNLAASRTRWKKLRDALATKTFPAGTTRGSLIYRKRDELVSALGERLNARREDWPDFKAAWKLLDPGVAAYRNINARLRTPRALPGFFARFYGTGRTFQDILNKYGTSGFRRDGVIRKT